MARYKTKVSSTRKAKRAPSRKTIAANEKHIDFVAKLDKLAGLKPYDRRKRASSIYSKPAKKAKTPSMFRTRAEKQAFHYGCICGASNARQSARSRTRARARRRSW